jgi:hypothetical protein
MKLKSFLPALILPWMLCLPILLLAQDDPGGDPAAVPIDGGLSILLAAGVGYAVKKGYEHRKKKKESDLPE